jgi:hypothetical protein
VQQIGAEAWIAFVTGQRDQALETRGRRYKSEKHPVSPGRLIPARELLADMLLESGRPGDALAEYEASQVRDPRGSAAIGAQARPVHRRQQGQSALSFRPAR